MESSSELLWRNIVLVCILILVCSNKVRLSLYFLSWPQLSVVGRSVALFSPLLTALLLTMVSGMPFSEVPGAKRQDELGNLEAYEAWRKRTSPLVPMPPSLWQKLPGAIQWIFGEWKRWEYNPTPRNTDYGTQ